MKMINRMAKPQVSHGFLAFFPMSVMDLHPNHGARVHMDRSSLRGGFSIGTSFTSNKSHVLGSHCSNFSSMGQVRSRGKRDVLFGRGAV